MFGICSTSGENALTVQQCNPTGWWLSVLYVFFTNKLAGGFSSVHFHEAKCGNAQNVKKTAGSSNRFSFLKYKTETLSIRCFSSTDWARSMASSSSSHVPIASPGHVLRGHEPVQILKDLQHTEWSLLGRLLPSLQRINNRVIKQSTSIHMCIFETDPLSESTYNVVCVFYITLHLILEQLVCGIWSSFLAV